jgi:hypothetical protein
MPKKVSDRDVLNETEQLHQSAEDLAVWLGKGTALPSTSEQLKEIQRYLFLTARDANQAACALYTRIKIAESEEKLAASKPVTY